MVNIGVPPILPAAVVKPTLDTPFHIDYEWWSRSGLNISVELRAHLCDEHQDVYREHFDTEKIDWVNGRTGEVTRVDGLQHVLQMHCSKQPGYINERLSLIDAIFRVFLANGNAPLNCRELSSIVGHAPEKLLRTLSGYRVYKGLRPAPAD
jgi:hypothetical protein